MKTKNLYRVPLEQHLISETVVDSPSHTGAYKGSIDFAVPTGTDVLAACDGIIVRVRDNSQKYGDDAIFGNDVNYITIKHLDNELSEYLHLAFDSGTVEVGQKVKAGQVIAKTGLSGWMYAPHLHFMVYKKTTRPEAFQCLEIKF